MRYTRVKAKNGIAIQLQSFSQEEGSGDLEIRIEMPANKRGGSHLIHDKDTERFIRNIDRAEGFSLDSGSFKTYTGRVYEHYINYAINGCTGVYVTVKGNVTQKKIDLAVNRIARICEKARLS